LILTNRLRAGTDDAGKAGRGRAGQGMAGKARRGKARLGMVRQSRRGMGWLGEAGRGRQLCFYERIIMKKKKVTYSFRQGATVAGLTADIVGQELNKIADQGELTPKAVVDSSRPSTAPLHPVFEWNDHVAAEKHREWQARFLIKSVQIQYESQPSTAAFYHVKVDDTPQYAPIRQVIDNPALLSSAVSCLRGKLEAAKSSLAQLMQVQSKADQETASAESIQLHLNAAIEAAKEL
jgi:hypothetical protein